MFNQHALNFVFVIVLGGIVIDSAVDIITSIFSKVVGKPSPRADGSKIEENALASTQSRIKMVLNYHFAQLTLWSKGSEGNLLVLGTSNAEDRLDRILSIFC